MLFPFLINPFLKGVEVSGLFPIRLRSQALSYASSPFVFHAVHSMCYSESQISENMVHRNCNIIKEFQDRLRELPYVPKTSFRRDSLGYCSDANKRFLTFYPVTTLSVYSSLRTSD